MKLLPVLLAATLLKAQPDSAPAQATDSVARRGNPGTVPVRPRRADGGGDSPGFPIQAAARPDTTAADSAAAPRQAAPRQAAPPWKFVTDGSVTVTGRLLPRRSRKSLTVGDRFEAEYTVRHHRDTRVSPLVTQSAGDFVVTDQRLTTRYHGDTILDVYRLELAGFATSPPGDSGPGPKVPPFLVTWATGSEVWAAQSDSLPVEITSVLAEGMEDINELKPQVSVPNLLPLFIAGAVILAAALTYLGFRLYRRLRRRKAEAEPPLAPWDEALAALGALPVLEWLDKGLVKKYYYAVSEIVKRYLSRRFGFAAVDETTTEIVRELKTAKVPERDRFTEFFYGADMVKYAKYLPSKPETAVDVARDLVRATTPKPEPPRPPATDSVPGSDGRPIRPPDSGPGSTGRPIRSPAGRADGKR